MSTVTSNENGISLGAESYTKEGASLTPIQQYFLILASERNRSKELRASLVKDYDPKSDDALLEDSTLGRNTAERILSRVDNMLSDSSLTPTKKNQLQLTQITAKTDRFLFANKQKDVLTRELDRLSRRKRLSSVEEKRKHDLTNQIGEINTLLYTLYVDPQLNFSVETIQQRYNIADDLVDQSKGLFEPDQDTSAKGMEAIRRETAKRIKELKSLKKDIRGEPDSVREVVQNLADTSSNHLKRLEEKEQKRREEQKRGQAVQAQTQEFEKIKSNPQLGQKELDRLNDLSQETDDDKLREAIQKHIQDTKQQQDNKKNQDEQKTAHQIEDNRRQVVEDVEKATNISQDDIDNLRRIISETNDPNLRQKARDQLERANRQQAVETENQKLQDLTGARDDPYKLTELEKLANTSPDTSIRDEAKRTHRETLTRLNAQELNQIKNKIQNGEFRDADFDRLYLISAYNTDPDIRKLAKNILELHVVTSLKRPFGTFYDYNPERVQLFEKAAAGVSPKQLENLPEISFTKYQEFVEVFTNSDLRLKQRAESIYFLITEAQAKLRDRAIFLSDGNAVLDQLKANRYELYGRDGGAVSRVYSRESLVADFQMVTQGADTEFMRYNPKEADWYRTQGERLLTQYRARGEDVIKIFGTDDPIYLGIISDNPIKPEDITIKDDSVFSPKDNDLISYEEAQWTYAALQQNLRIAYLRVQSITENRLFTTRGASPTSNVASKGADLPRVPGFTGREIPIDYWEGQLRLYNSDMVMHPTLGLISIYKIPTSDPFFKKMLTGITDQEESTDLRGIEQEFIPNIVKTYDVVQNTLKLKPRTLEPLEPTDIRRFTRDALNGTFLYIKDIVLRNIMTGNIAQRLSRETDIRTLIPKIKEGEADSKLDELSGIYEKNNYDVQRQAETRRYSSADAGYGEVRKFSNLSRSEQREEMTRLWLECEFVTQRDANGNTVNSISGSEFIRQAYGEKIASLLIKAYNIREDATKEDERKRILAKAFSLPIRVKGVYTTLNTFQTFMASRGYRGFNDMIIFDPILRYCQNEEQINFGRMSGMIQALLLQRYESIDLEAAKHYLEDSIINSYTKTNDRVSLPSVIADEILRRINLDINEGGWGWNGYYANTLMDTYSKIRVGNLRLDQMLNRPDLDQRVSIFAAAAFLASNHQQELQQMMQSSLAGSEYDSLILLLETAGISERHLYYNLATQLRTTDILAGLLKNSFKTFAIGRAQIASRPTIWNIASRSLRAIFPIPLSWEKGVYASTLFAANLGRIIVDNQLAHASMFSFSNLNSPFSFALFGGASLLFTAVRQVRIRSGIRYQRRLEDIRHPLIRTFLTKWFGRIELTGRATPPNIQNSETPDAFSSILNLLRDRAGSYVARRNEVRRMLIEEMAEENIHDPALINEVLREHDRKYHNEDTTIPRWIKLCRDWGIAEGTIKFIMRLQGFHSGEQRFGMPVAPQSS